MEIVILVILMAAGAVVGYFLRRFRQLIKGANRRVGITLYVLLFTLGLSIGHRPEVRSNLHTLGLQSLAITVLLVAGSIAAGWLFEKLLLRGTRRVKGEN